jgi:hypothetical protein
MGNTATKHVSTMCGKPEISFAPNSNAWDRCVPAMAGSLGEELTILEDAISSTPRGSAAVARNPIRLMECLLHMDEAKI